jgi:hypothetical protein
VKAKVEHFADVGKMISQSLPTIAANLAGILGA